MLSRTKKVNTPSSTDRKPQKILRIFSVKDHPFLRCGKFLALKYSLKIFNTTIFLPETKGRTEKESLSTALYKYLWAAYREDDLEQQRN